MADRKSFITPERHGSRHPLNDLQSLANKYHCDISGVEFVKRMDEQDTLRGLRHEYHLPKMKDIPEVDKSLVNPDSECIYFVGNSQGPCPKETGENINLELSKWAKLGFNGFTDHNVGLPWATCDEDLETSMATLVGSVPGEVAIMNGLSVNMHLMLVSFYRPTPKRHKILCEKNAFPSDYYAFQSQISLNGYDPSTSLIYVEPRKGDETLRMEDILAKITTEGESIAVICLGGVQFITGQVLDMQSITLCGHAKGCYVGFDLAHAVANVPLYLHDWKVDFACWCTYKYINSVPGGLGCIFIHNTHERNDFPKLLGWWGHKAESRFDMDNKMNLSTGARGYRITNPPPLLCASIKTSLDIFNKTTMEDIRAKSRLMTAYLEFLITDRYKHGDSTDSIPPIKVITPSDPEQRGNQMSLTFPNQDVAAVFEELGKRGVLCTARKGFVIRIAMAPLYNSFDDIHRFMTYLDQALKAAVTK
ncbi:kynureninase-like [Ylistrum balloti]|uniref:kynureninase-like n=1 Tax=Ylistrum balloti TaxID=509963 RepID=UPI002905BE4F|nr:kynureninase-like [Ylistrum balloti]